MLKPSLLAAVMVALPLMAPVQVLAQDQSADTVVATVNGQDITLGQMIVMRQSIQDPSVADLSDQDLWDMLLEQLVRQAVMAGEGKENAAIRAQLELQRRNTLATEAVAALAETAPTQDEIKAAYDRLFGEAEPVKEYSAAHILVATEDEAKEIRQQLEDGADFGELAAQKSQDNSSQNKGDLGWFSADMMVEPFANAVEALENGQISDPVQSDFGWHVIRLNETRMREVPKMEEVQTEVEQFVRRENLEAAVERLVGEAKVEKAEGIPAGAMNDTALLEAE
ncbi:peptidylprolyl isomerase [Paracoccus fistulariae]|uniref:Parvulin-like PPIase n=1 Tax=Paracoccus fistulariae TaxID=658446 RepID=A0ABY7SIC6_9RHOB|nr:peptidylprolyl isomerase [Paracoccus fistulariae]MDB6182119.1 peptidylprolyl isomerase [Paracoccus fistulariae]WCR06654.1 peptidylprolyl isomerase [Paracoccus fistulariae]